MHLDVKHFYEESLMIVSLVTGFAYASFSQNKTSEEITVVTPPVPPPPPPPMVDPAPPPPPPPPPPVVGKNVKSIRLKDDMATVTLSSGKTKVYNLAEEKQRKEFERKYGRIRISEKDIPAPPVPPTPPSIDQ